MALPQAPHQSLALTVADQIRTAIDSGELAPGERLVERKLAAQLGVSHIPVREALARLEDEGVIVRSPRRGARVAQLSERDLDEITSIRILLEELAVKRAMSNWTAEGKADIDRIVDEMTARAAAADAEGLVEADRAFHEEIWRLADHDLLLDLARDARLRVNRFLRAATEDLDRAGLLAKAEEHRVLAELLASGNVAAAKRGMRRHIETAAARVELSLPAA